MHTSGDEAWRHIFDLKHHTCSGLKSNPGQDQFGVHTTHVFSAWIMWLGLDSYFLEKLLSTLEEAYWHNSSELAGCWPVLHRSWKASIFQVLNQATEANQWGLRGSAGMSETWVKDWERPHFWKHEALTTERQPRRPSTQFDVIPVPLTGPGCWRRT